MPQDISAAIPIRASAVLTTSYVAAAVIGASENSANNGLRNQLLLLVDFTLGSLTSGGIKVEFSPDGTDYYQETFEAIAAGVATDTLGVHTFTATGKYRLAIPCKDNFIKVSAIGTGTVDDSLMAIKAVVGIA
jgi:hypothetical protein